MSETCAGCKRIQNENKLLRSSIIETNKEYVSLANENLALKRELEEIKAVLVELKPVKGLYYEGYNRG